LEEEPVLSRLLGAEAPVAVAGIAGARERLMSGLCAQLRAALRDGCGEAPTLDERLLVDGALALVDADRSAVGPSAGSELAELLSLSRARGRG
jgi:hypothetical protein